MSETRFAFTLSVVIGMILLSATVLGLPVITGIRIVAEAGQAVGCTAACTASEARDGIDRPAWTVSSATGRVTKSGRTTKLYPVALAHVRADTVETALPSAQWVGLLDLAGSLVDASLARPDGTHIVLAGFSDENPKIRTR